MARKLTNTVDSISELAPNYREHRTRIGDLVAPKASWTSLAAIRRAVNAR